MAMKSNRLVALSEENRKQKCFTRLDPLEWPETGIVTGGLKGLNFPVRLTRQIFTNKEGSTGTLYRVCSPLDASWETITTVYQKRWQVEVFHQSLKSNAAFAQSPARTHTQANHLFASIVAVFKREKIKMCTKLNHFALKSKLYVKAIRTAFDELQALRAA